MSPGRDDRNRQGMLGFMVKPGAREEVTGRIGLTLVAEALRAIGVDEIVADHLKLAKRTRGFTEYAKVEAIALLVAAGGERVEDIRVLSEDKGLVRLLGEALPSPDALLDLLNGFDDPRVWEGKPADEKSWVPPETAALKALFEVNREVVHRAATLDASVATIDHDGTIIEAHKREARVAYEGTRGYQPLVAVWVEEDLIVGDEFRDGNVPGNKDPLASVKRAFEALPVAIRRRYFRGDSADYSLPLLKYLVAEKIVFTISADMSPELRTACEKLDGGRWQFLEQRERESVHLAEVEFVSGDWPKTAAPLRYVAMRFSPLQGEALRHSRARTKIPRRGNQPADPSRARRSAGRRVDERCRPGALALGEGGDHRTCPPGDEGRAWRRGAALPTLRSQRRLVPPQRAHLQRPHVSQATRASPPVSGRPTEAPAVRVVHHARSPDVQWAAADRRRLVELSANR